MSFEDYQRLYGVIVTIELAAILGALLAIAALIKDLIREKR